MKSQPTNRIEEQLKNLFEYYSNGRLVDAERLARSITRETSSNKDAWKAFWAILQKTGKVKESLAAIQKAGQISPSDVKICYSLGYTLLQLGKLVDAVETFRKAIFLKPDYAEAHHYLGETLKRQGELEEAETAYVKAIAFKPNYDKAYFNLGNMLQELGRLDEAEASYKKAISLKPDYAEFYATLGATLKRMGRLNKAEASYKKAIALKPDHAVFHYDMGAILQRIGRSDEAEESYKKAIALKPTFSSIVKHKLAALTGKTTKTAPRDYVEQLFDGYAAKFEIDLKDKLDYKIPKILAEIMIRDSKFDFLGSVTDLGCGTGLFGVEINQVCEYLEGIDLSGKMLEKAKEKNVYTKLVKQDITEYLSTTNLNFDFFVSTDVFIYIGDLFEVFRLIKSRNNKRGKLVFSTEHRDGDKFFLEQSGRYSHSKKYIDSLCKTFGYEVRHFEIQNLRKEKNQYIKGGLYILDF